MRHLAVTPVLLAATLAHAQTPTAPTSAADPARLTVERIFGRGEFAVAGAPGLQWLRDGRSYVEVRPAVGGGGTDIVRVDATTGAATVLVPASALHDEAGRPIVIEDMQLSPDERKALLFHNSVRVWRTNTRGTFHVVDFASRRVTPIATITTPGKPAAAASNAPPSNTSGANRSGVRVRITVAGRPDTVAGQALGQRTEGVPAAATSFIGRGLASGAVDATLQMFAKFSPDSRSVAYVRGNNLWVTDLATGRATRLTYDGSDDVINGTTDWVYEEELGLRDAFRWSPDSRRLAYWRFDQAAVPAYPIVDATDGQYPTVSVLRYPKAGAPNSRVKVGVVAAAGGGPTRWLAVGPDTGQYVPQMEWLGTDSVAVLRMPRRQNRLDVLLASASTGGVRTVTSDVDSAYVDVEGGPVTWIDGGRRFLLRSDRTGWRGFHLYDRSGRFVRQVTPDGADYLELAGIDSARGVAYISAAAPTPTQRNLYRCTLGETAGGSAGGSAAPSCVRVTTADGTHAVELAPGAAYAVDTYSTAAKPPVAALLALSATAAAAAALRPVRVLEDNAAVAARLAALGTAAPQFFRVPMPDGTLLDAYRIVPARFDSAARHPVLMHVYGGPAAPQVNDAWGGSRAMWHELLAQQGYVVVVVDNRGAAWRGRAFRKSTQGRLGVLESQDQIDAARWVGQQRWADPARVGIWGWSYGGYMTALTLARGGSVFKAGVSVAPVVDWRFYDSIYTERYMWTPQDNPNGYQRSAVTSYVGNMAAKLLLAYGTGDDNVHPQNGLVLAQALENADKRFEMLLYPNKTHSISGARTQVHLFGSLTRFVLDNL